MNTEIKTKIKANNALSYHSMSQNQFGDEFQVLGFQGEAIMQERLSEIGIRSGMKLTYFSRAPFSGPCIFRVAATSFALREEEFACLILEKI